MAKRKQKCNKKDKLAIYDLCSKEAKQILQMSFAFRKQTIWNFNGNLYSEVSDNKYTFLIDKNEEF